MSCCINHSLICFQLIANLSSFLTSLYKHSALPNPPDRFGFFGVLNTTLLGFFNEFDATLLGPVVQKPVNFNPGLALTLG